MQLCKKKRLVQIQSIADNSIGGHFTIQQNNFEHPVEAKEGHEEVEYFCTPSQSSDLCPNYMHSRWATSVAERRLQEEPQV